MRGGFLLGLALGLSLLACGGSKADDFADDPEKAGEAGKGGSGATGGSAGMGALCAPGLTQPCLGPGQCAGAQVCAPTGDGWGTCDCGTPASAGTSGGGGSGNVSGSGGDANQGGGGGTGGGKAGSGGSGGSGGTSGSGVTCNTDSCVAYCAEYHGNCKNDTPAASCVSTCMTELCSDKACFSEDLAVHECIVAGTPACVSDQTLPSGVDCRAEGKSLYDCLGGIPWQCDEADGSCICSRSATAATGPATCMQKYACCVADAAGLTCGCGSKDFCALLSPSFTLVDHCPLD